MEIMTMSYATQDFWETPIAIYLFLGGLGAATVVITFLTHMYYKPYKELVIWGALSGSVMLMVGTAMLVIDLLDPLAMIHVVNPMRMFDKGDAWIVWGVQAIQWMVILGILYVLPYLLESPFFNRLPLVKTVFGWRIVKKLCELILRFHKPIGLITVFCGVFTAVYTGLVLQSMPAVALWNNPGVPVLFTVSAFSTAMAYLILTLGLVLKRHKEDHQLAVLYERADVILIAWEIFILFSFFFFLLMSSPNADHSYKLLWGNAGWVIGFIVLGLFVPLLLELKGVWKGWNGRAPVMLAAVLVLMGGYLLRHYFLQAGVYTQPW
jgi:polysulfide reductase chain C